jgi:hypothetical protein
LNAQAQLPQEIRTRLKPGLMSRVEKDVPEAWILYEPITDASFRFKLHETGAGDLAVADLYSNDRSWEGGQFRPNLYHAAKAVRAHEELQEANLEINYLCHYACRHCFQSLYPSQNKLSAPDGAAQREAADRLIEAGVWEISITGGDIFLDCGIWDLLDYIHERAPNITLRLLVNGGGLCLDDEEVKEKLRRLVGRRVIFKSDFFGHNAELHDGFTRVAGSFEKLVSIDRFLQSAGLAAIPTAALTRMNFEKRFELVNFLYNLSDDCFTVSSILYPSDFRPQDALNGLRLTPEQHAELMEERFFSPLAAEYHTFEPQCGGDCQFAVTSASGQTWGCSFLKIGGADNHSTDTNNGATALDSPPLLHTVRSWRAAATRRAEFPDCATCPAERTCRKCPSFINAGQMGDAYCTPSRGAFPHLMKRVKAAVDHGFDFVHQSARLRARALA